MFEMQQELLNKTRACNKAQILHTPYPLNL